MGQLHRILIVDDEDYVCHFLAGLVRSLGHEPEIALDGWEALAKLKLDIDLVLLDLSMPGMDGFEVARRIRKDPDMGDVPVIMVTAFSDKEDRLQAVEAGANDFIAKPVDRTELRVRMASLLKLKEQQDALKRHRAELQETVEKRTATLRRALEEMTQAQRQAREAHLDTIQRLARAAEYKDEDTAAHIERMSRYCELLARALHWAPSQVELIRYASAMHDVGKIGIPDSILLKPDTLTADEWEVIKQHTTIGARILHGSPSELLQAGQTIALSHHEHWNGSGYPQGLAREEIPLLGRISALADVFDALTTDRPYRPALSNDQALAIIREGREVHFDPQLVDLFFDHLPAVFAIQEQGGKAPNLEIQ